MLRAGLSGLLRHTDLKLMLDADAFEKLKRKNDFLRR